MPKAKQEKSNSLVTLGYLIEPAQGKDSKGNDVALKVSKGEKTYFVVTTKRGNLKAVKDLQNPVETTIEGLYQLKAEGSDLVGRRAPAPQPKPVSASA